MADAAAANPGAERSLLEHAQASSFAELRDEALRARAAGEDCEATERRINAARQLRTGCTVEGCPRTRVEVDHRVPFSESGHTRLDECDPLCTLHHRQKHRDGWALVEGVGKRPLVPPDDPRHPKNRRKRE